MPMPVSMPVPSTAYGYVGGFAGGGATAGLPMSVQGPPVPPKTSSAAAYCAQTAWLVNETVRQNILGKSNYDEAWYDSVTKACALDHDFQQFPKGDLSLVGSKGISLSGGQKNRVVRIQIASLKFVI